MELATLGGGCFWCVEAVFEQLEGVEQVTPGYAGGILDCPTYEQVCSGLTGHAEVVQITFDPERLDYRTLIEVFFAIHDPTTLNRQGNDVGTQYRSVIFTHSDGQEAIVKDLLAQMGIEGWFASPIVTEVAPVPCFFPAENYHQEYFRRNPAQGYCVYVVSPKLAKFRKRFSQRLKPEFRPG